MTAPGSEAPAVRAAVAVGEVFEELMSCRAIRDRRRGGNADPAEQAAFDLERRTP